jgi:sugar porter (SP) family MFS transporter
VAGFAREALSGKNKFLMRIAIIAAIGGFLFGYDTGVISGALLFIKKDLHASQFEQQWIVGSLLLGAVVGAVISGYLAGKIGRRKTKILSGSVYVVGAVLSALAFSTWFLIGVRFITGLAVGTASFVSVEYISEQAPPRVRGGVTSFNQLMVTSGILIAYLVDFAFKGVFGSWRWMLGLAALPGAALAFGMMTVPESPRWLVQVGREDDAREVLSKTREEEEIDDEIASIQEAAERSARLDLRDLFGPRLRRLMVVGLALATFQQLIGVNTVIYYSATIFSYTGLSASTSVLRAIFIGITNVVFTVVAILLLDRVGRRVLLLTGTAICVVSLVGLGMYFHFPTLQHDYGWLALASLILFIVGFAIGLGPVFWLMISEIYPLGVRSRAMAIATVANWTFNFLVSYFFLELVSTIGKAGTFWLYAGCGIVAFTYFLIRVPETRNRSLEEIERELGVEPERPAA